MAPNGLDLGDEGAEELPEVHALLQTLATTPIDSLSFHKAIQGYLSRCCAARRGGWRHWNAGSTATR